MRFSSDIGVFEIESMPNQGQVAICFGFYVYELMRRQGFAKDLHEMQIIQLKKYGYDYAICTVAGDNPAQSRSIANAGWRMTNEFYNTRTGIKTQVWEIDLSTIKSTSLAKLAESEAA